MYSYSNMHLTSFHAPVISTIFGCNVCEWKTTLRFFIKRKMT